MNFHILRDKFNSCIQVHGLSYIQHITNSQSDQFPVGLIAQLVEYHTRVAEVHSSLNYFQTSISHVTAFIKFFLKWASRGNIKILEYFQGRKFPQMQS